MSKLALLSGMFSLLSFLVKQSDSLEDPQVQLLSQLAVTSYQALYIAALGQDQETESDADAEGDKDDGVAELTAMKTASCLMQMTSCLVSVVPVNVAHNIELIGVLFSLAGFGLVKERGLTNEDERVNMYKVDSCVIVAAPNFLSNLSALLNEFGSDVLASRHTHNKVLSYAHNRRVYVCLCVCLCIFLPL